MGRIAYRARGAGRPVLLLHPVGLDGAWWSTYVECLAERYHVIAVDMPGHGRSSSIHAPITLGEIARGVAAVLQAETDRPAHVIGVSMGGMVAQHLALQWPQGVASLVLCATTGTFADDLRPLLRERGTAAREGMGAVVGATLERWFSPRGRTAPIGRRCAQTLAANDPASWAASWAAISELETLERLGDLRIPALVITGEADITTPPAASAALAAALPDARLEIVPDAWHMGVFEEPQSFLNAFTRFLDSLGDREPTIAEHYVRNQEPNNVVPSDK
jgi:3-oxoadipate enol-lactonase